MLRLIALIWSLLFPTPTPLPTVVPPIFFPTPPATQITLIVTGDVLPARTINARSIDLGDFTWPWQATRSFLQQADVTYINLETPLVEKCPVNRSGMVFCGDTRNVDGLVDAGIDVANLANNHINNFGKEGIESTERILKSRGIYSTGISNPAILNIKNKRFAFLGFNAVPLSIKTEDISSQIISARKIADYVIVQYHWGNEYTTTISNQQRQLAYLAIDAGADLVVGNHPHWVQPEEVYRGKVIKYAFGNFIFDQFWSAETLAGEIGKFVFSDGQLISHEYIPVRIDQFGQPHLPNTK